MLKMERGDLTKLFQGAWLGTSTSRLHLGELSKSLVFTAETLGDLRPLTPRLARRFLEQLPPPPFPRWAGPRDMGGALGLAVRGGAC